MKNNHFDQVISQGIAAYSKQLESIRLSEFASTINSILSNQSSDIASIVSKHSNALNEINISETLVKTTINSNRGGDTGIHGFLAEYAEVGIRNAKNIMNNLEPITELLNNNGPADLLVNNKEVQMKFYENILNEIKQAQHYRGMDMMFPKDHVEIIYKIMNGEKIIYFNGSRLHSSTIQRIKEEVINESNKRGQNFKEWILQSEINYKDAQRNNIHDTLNSHKEHINQQANNQKSQVNNKAKNEKNIAANNAKPSFSEASKVAGIGAAIQGGISFGMFVYNKHKEGKEIWDFDVNDWKDCGIDTSKGAIKGGFSGYAVYGLTNVCNLSAPIAGAVATGSYGLLTASIKYRINKIDSDEFNELVFINAIDCAGAMIGASIGQAIIPIPVVGALIGTIVATTAVNMGKDYLTQKELEIISQYELKVSEYLKGLDENYQLKYDELIGKYNAISQIQEVAFDVEMNAELQFAYSISLAQAIGVEEKDILTSIDEIDSFFG